MLVGQLIETPQLKLGAPEASAVPELFLLVTHCAEWGSGAGIRVGLDGSRLLFPPMAGHHCGGMHRCSSRMRRENARYRGARLRRPAQRATPPTYEPLDGGWEDLKIRAWANPVRKRRIFHVVLRLQGAWGPRLLRW